MVLPTVLPYKLAHLAPVSLLPVLNDLRTRDSSEYREFFANLIEDIKERGVVLPLLGFQEGVPVRIIDGETRRLAALTAGVETVPVLVYEQMPDPSALELAQAQANAMRLDMTPLEYAQFYQDQMNKHHWSQVELAQHLHVSEGKISKDLSLIKKLPADLMALIGSGKDRLCVTAAAALTRLPTHEIMREVAQLGLGMTRDNVEALVTAKLGKKGGKTAKVLKLTYGGVTVTVKGNPSEELKAFIAKANEALKKMKDNNLPPESLPSLMK